jgi:hypothetical protein
MGYITKTKLESEGSNQPDRVVGALGISSYYHAYITKKSPKQLCTKCFIVWLLVSIFTWLEIPYPSIRTSVMATLCYMQSVTVILRRV